MPVFKAIFRQTLAAIPVNLNTFVMGLSNGWISPTLETLSHPESVLPLTTDQSSLIASMQEIGRVAGSILAVTLIDAIGRKRSFIVSSTIFFLQWVFVYSTQSVWVLYSARIICGIATGVHDVSSAIYIGENSSTEFRGVFSSVLVSFFYFGILVEFIFTNFFSYYDVAFINCLVSGVSLLTTVLLKEPAQYLIMKGNVDRAEKNFVWLRGTNDEGTQREFASIRENLSKERDRKKSLVKLLSTPFIYKIILIVFVLYTLGQATGFSAVNSYATLSFSSGYFTKKELTILLGAMQLVAVSLSTLIIERFPRKSIMITLLGFVSLVHLCSASLFFVQQYVCQIDNFSWYIFSSISSYPVICAVGILPTLSLLRGELFPQSVKAVGGCACMVGNSLMGICMNSAYLGVALRYGMFANYLFFAVCSFVTLLYVRCVLPETRGKSLIEIQKCIDKKSYENRSECA